MLHRSYHSKATNRFAVHRFYLYTTRLFVSLLSPIHRFLYQLNQKGPTRFRPLKRAPE